MALDDLIRLAGALSLLLTPLAALLGVLWGRSKARADAALAQAAARKTTAEARLAEAEVTAAETEASVEAVVGKIDDRLDRLETSMKRVLHEVTPNTGGSIKDAVARIERGFSDLARTVDKLDTETTSGFRRMDHQFGEVHDRQQAADARALREHEHLWEAINPQTPAAGGHN